MLGGERSGNHKCSASSITNVHCHSFLFSAIQSPFHFPKVGATHGSNLTLNFPPTICQTRWFCTRDRSVDSTSTTDPQSAARMPRLARARIDSSFFVCTRPGSAHCHGIAHHSSRHNAVLTCDCFKWPVQRITSLFPIEHTRVQPFTFQRFAIPTPSMGKSQDSPHRMSYTTLSFINQIFLFLSFPYLPLDGIALWVTRAHRTSSAASKNGEESANFYRAISAFILRVGPMVKFETLRVTPEPVNGVLVTFWS